MTTSAVPLSTWDQIAPRNYIRQVYCFPCQGFQNGDLQPLSLVLRLALDCTCVDLPDFAGKVALASSPLSHVIISKHVDDRAVLEVVDHSETFALDYVELKARGFPAQAFVGSEFDLQEQVELGSLGVPATKIQARVIRGGLMLCVNIHHSITDGIGMTNFVSAFALYTRCQDCLLLKDLNLARRAELPAEASSAVNRNDTFEALMKRCPEYWAMHNNCGPLTFRVKSTSVPFESIPKEGRIFVLSADSIALLKKTATKYRSHFINKANHLPVSTFLVLRP